VVGQPEDIEVLSLEWDDENLEHIARHGLSTDDIEFAHMNRPLYFPKFAGPRSNTRDDWRGRKQPLTRCADDPKKRTRSLAGSDRLAQQVSPSLVQHGPGELIEVAERKKTYRELAEGAESIKDTPAEIEGLVPVKARVSENLTSVFSVRLGIGELGKITRAANARGQKVGAFVREAALAAAAGELDTPEERGKARKEAAEHIRALAALVERL
jgi:hypothetical protein